MKIEKISNSEEDTINLGKKLGKLLKPGDLVLLYGELGCGKTTFVKGLAESLEVDPDLYITSPSFSLINIYEGKYTIYHVDLYRLNTPEVEDLGLWEYLNDGVVIIEWADRLQENLKEEYIEIFFEFLDYTKRKITFVGYGEWQELLKALDWDEV
ncbi:MAG: tRNA (adenosine(37)-N6)-threonylcarbamoyltransferase complex ATPase subunit type 1 TsaE [Thermodesulfobacterium sp.]|nr:tRNA (adenosine(37)-N6)-threonylcarbamoyltransferase complex ATPase subunit type 1 TsaE [Thermodesulfobacterium sp.]HEA84137.1 tRNA (adenosine(37)-N6)-threonylcarbamoyltransferase complex ATPase subunit type 1 TsaE [Thermodesulfobacterium geofontis]